MVPAIQFLNVKLGQRELADCGQGGVQHADPYFCAVIVQGKRHIESDEKNDQRDDQGALFEASYKTAGVADTGVQRFREFRFQHLVLPPQRPV